MGCITASRLGKGTGRRSDRANHVADAYGGRRGAARAATGLARQVHRDPRTDYGGTDGQRRRATPPRTGGGVGFRAEAAAGGVARGDQTHPRRFGWRTCGYSDCGIAETSTRQGGGGAVDGFAAHGG